MRIFRASLAVFFVTVVPLPWLLTHCSSGDTKPGNADAGDATVQDAPAEGAPQPDVATPDSSSTDAQEAQEAQEAQAADGEATVDSPPDSPAAPDASDGGQDGGQQDGSDASEAAADAGIPAIPCSVDGGDAGDAGSACPGMLTCCNGWCADTSKDPKNCGACGNPCTATQFCTGLACDDAILKNICANPKATWLIDDYGADNAASNDMGTGLAMGCTPPVTILTASEDGGTAQDPISARPITGAGDTLVAGGGWFGHASVVYMDGQGLTPLILSNDGTNAWILNRKTMMNIVFTNQTLVTAQHDYFLLELSVEPTSGSLCFFGYGMDAGGTGAAGYFFRNNVVPNRATFTDAWYVYEWTTTGAGVPSASDTFTLLAHGM
ncbi:MAG: hypothetical protein M3O46_10190 [Myxococcota bacterium]|nr:hypothetical protein [Myxococcota bacterium]